MNLVNGSLVTSPTDLSHFLECEHLTQLEVRAARGEITRPVVDDPEGDVVRARGMQHERRYPRHVCDVEDEIQVRRSPVVIRQRTLDLDQPWPELLRQSRELARELTAWASPAPAAAA